MKSITLNTGNVALVSDVDYHWLSQHRWTEHTANASGKPYARASMPDENGRQRTVYMHRAIARAPSGMRVDHRDNNGLHNWRSNLRVCSQNENNWNQGPHGLIPYKGVTKHGGFLVRIQVNGERKHVGRFKTAYEAAIAYDVEAFKLFGEFAYLNFPELFPATMENDNVSHPFDPPF